MQLQFPAAPVASGAVLAMAAAPTSAVTETAAAERLDVSVGTHVSLAPLLKQPRPGQHCFTVSAHELPSCTPMSVGLASTQLDEQRKTIKINTFNVDVMAIAKVCHRRA